MSAFLNADVASLTASPGMGPETNCSNQFPGNRRQGRRLGGHRRALQLRLARRHTCSLGSCYASNTKSRAGFPKERNPNPNPDTATHMICSPHRPGLSDMPTQGSRTSEGSLSSTQPTVDGGRMLTSREIVTATEYVLSPHRAAVGCYRGSDAAAECSPLKPRPST